MQKNKIKKSDVKNEDSKIVLEIRNISKKLRDGENLKEVLIGIKFLISAKDFVGIIGSSGSGKSVLLNAITGIDNPDSGLIYFNGKNFTELTNGEKNRLRLKEMGFIFRENNLIEFLNIKENLELPLQLAGIGGFDVKMKVEKLISEFELQEIILKMPNEITNLEEKKVALAKSLIFEPRIIFMDEPTGDLTTNEKDDFFKIIAKLHSKNKFAFMIFSHDSQIAMKVSKVIRIENGKII